MIRTVTRTIGSVVRRLGLLEPCLGRAGHGLRRSNLARKALPEIDSNVRA